MNNNGNEVAEKFDYERVSEVMEKVIEDRNDARGIMNTITDILSAAVSNTENDSSESDKALGGNTKEIWELWNSFYESFDLFSTSMNTMYESVVTAQTTNKSFESGTATTINNSITNNNQAS